MSDFDKGYACAIACIVKGHGAGTEVSEALQANGLTSVKILKDRGVDEYDIEVLKPVLVDIHNDNYCSHGRLLMVLCSKCYPKEYSEAINKRTKGENK